MLGLFFSSKWSCGFYLVRLSLLLKLEVSSSGVTLYLCKSTIQPFQQFPYLGWGRGEGGGGVPSFYLHKLQKWICRIIGPSLAVFLELLAHCWNVANWRLSYKHYIGRFWSEFAELAPLIHSRGRCTHYSNSLLDFSVVIPRCYKDVYVNSFIHCTTKIWSFLPAKCLPLTYDLNGFKPRANKHLFSFGSF